MQVTEAMDQSARSEHTRRYCVTRRAIGMYRGLARARTDCSGPAAPLLADSGDPIGAHTLVSPTWPRILGPLSSRRSPAAERRLSGPCYRRPRKSPLSDEKSASA
jgi:hypothetical protein